MEVIKEDFHDIQYFAEGSGDSRKLYLEGVVAQAEIANKNKRFYPRQVLETEIRRYVRENVQENRAMGELGHPQGPNINLERACIVMREMSQDGNDFWGKAEVLTELPLGKIVEGLLHHGVAIGISTRALGSLKPRHDGLNEVQSDLRLLACDLVADPSAPKAFMRGIAEAIEEQADFIHSLNPEYFHEMRAEIRRTANPYRRPMLPLNEVANYERVRYISRMMNQ